MSVSEDEDCAAEDEVPTPRAQEKAGLPPASRSAMSASALEAAAASAESRARIEGIDLPYFLWLATVATAVLASVSLLMALGLYVLNFLGTLIFDTPFFVGTNYIGILRVVGIFAGMSLVAHLLRLRMVALANSAQPIPFPDQIVAAPSTGDPSIDKFECLGRVSIHVYDLEVADLILANRPLIQQALTSALGLAISDPVVRYSKDKIEHTLRMGLGNILPLKSIAAITLSELRHRPRSHHR